MPNWRGTYKRAEADLSKTKIGFENVPNQHTAYWAFVFQQLWSALSANKKPVFGFVLLVCLLIAAYLGLVSYRPEFSTFIGVFGLSRTLSSQEVATNARSEEIVPLSNLTPQQIKSYIENLPPAQREFAGESYSGITISWRVGLSSVSKDWEGGKSSIMLISTSTERWDNSYIYCEVSLGDHPQLSITSEKEAFFVRGIIESVSRSGSINLKDCRFVF